MRLRLSGAGLLRARPGQRSAIVVWCTALLLLGTAWIFVNPTPSGTDEPAHYIRALAVSQGELTGPPARFPDRDPAHPEPVHIWDQQSRTFLVPARQAPASTFACDAGTWLAPATCTDNPCTRWGDVCRPSPPASGEVRLTTYTGDYEPTFYVVPGLMARLGSDDVSGLLAARFGQLLVALAFLGLAALLLWKPRGSNMAMSALLIAVTPMAIYMNTVVNPNGGEIVASIAFACAVIRIRRDGAGTPRWVWIVAGVCGFLCAFSRILAPLWVVVATAAVIALLGPRGAWRTLRAGGGYAAFAVSASAAGVLVDQAWWHFIVGIPQPLPSFGPTVADLKAVVGALPLLLQQHVAAFGWGEGDISAGPFVYLAWAVVLAVLVTLAVIVGSRRERITLAVLAAFDVAFTVISGTVERAEFGFGGTGTLGRYLLPLTALTVLLSGETLGRGAWRLRDAAPRNWTAVAGVVTAICQGVSLWMAARAYAVGINGPLMFLAHSQWRPPLGWGPWLTGGAVGCAGIAIAGWLVRDSAPRLHRDEQQVQESSVVASPATVLARSTE